MWEGSPVCTTGGIDMATKHGKKFREAAAKVDRAAVYSPLEAVKLVK